MANNYAVGKLDAEGDVVYTCAECGNETFIPMKWTPDYTAEQYLADYPTEECDVCETKKDAGKPGHCIECGVALNEHTRSSTMPNEGRDAQRCDSCFMRSWELLIHDQLFLR